MEAEGTRFRTGVDVGVDITGPAAARPLRRGRARRSARPSPRDLPVPGRELDGIHQAMEYLPQANRVALGETGRRTRSPPTGKHVVIIGGGDTGADCLGTAHPPGRERR